MGAGSRKYARYLEAKMIPMQWFVDNGCELVHPNIEVFKAIYQLEDRDPCKRCNCKDTCPAWPKVKTRA